MIIHNVEQRSPSWFALRCGRITSTSFDTMANGRKDGVETLCLKTAAERLTGVPLEEPYTSPAMENGMALEELARKTYETTVFQTVQTVGFIEYDSYVGVSTDGLVGEDGGIEVKCPMAHTHLKYLTSEGKAWKAYRWQIQGCLWTTGRGWWDFVSFNQSFPAKFQLLIERVTPDKEAFEALEKGAAHCRARINEILQGVS